MAEAAISSLVKLLGDVLIEKVKSLRGVEGKVRSLKKELEMMRAFLKDSDQKQYKDQGVRQWISQIRELTQDAEDTIELFVVDVVRKRSQGLLKKVISYPKSVCHLSRLGDEIDSILKDLEAIKGMRVTYGITNLAEAAVVDTAPVERRRRQIEHHPVGLEDDERKLLQEWTLNEEKKGLSIAVVEGMGGIGKSTLARKIYNHPDVVGGPFECRAWVVVSREFMPQETIKQLILEVAGSSKKDAVRKEIKKLEGLIKDNLHLLTKLKEMLCEQLQGKAYFIVLDDVWEENHWKFLKDAFPTTNQQDKKCRLLITTRNGDMSKYGQYSHKMKVLSPEKSWELFQNNALVDGECPKKLEDVGKQIVGKCNGLPLAISVVGGLLLGKHEVDDWNEVLYSLLEDDKKKINIVLSILELSYQNLSPQLKSCFMCLAFFKEDEVISVTRLIHIWIGQGLIQHEVRVRAEEIARGYLDELINLNIVQVRVKDLTTGRRVKTCQVHDLVHEICVRKAKEEIGLEILKPEPEAQNTSTLIELSSRKPRHCVAHGDNLVRFSSQHNKQIRSLFLVESRRFESRYWKSFHLLKRIELGDCGLMRKLPSCFRSLIGLEYLRLFAWHIKFPRWLEDLKKLEIIDVEGGRVNFPKGKMKLESLRYLRAYYVYGVDNIEDWKNIDILKHIKIYKSACISKLTGSCRIRELGISLDLDEDQFSFSRTEPLFEKMDNLVKLEIEWSGELYNIPQVGNCLTKLILNGRLRRCPSVNVFPPKLSHLTLKWSSLEDDLMIELSKLPNLVFLKISSRAYVGVRMKVIYGGFPRLEVLSLDTLLFLKGVDIEEGGMPHLTHLRIHECRHLNTENLLAKQITISHIMHTRMTVIGCITRKSDPPHKVKERAMHLLRYGGFGKYNLLKNNCEIFAMYCKTGHIKVNSCGQASPWAIASTVFRTLLGSVRVLFNVLARPNKGLCTCDLPKLDR